jgi:hypothetical protein
MVQSTCARCSAPFPVTKPNRKFCSSGCCVENNRAETKAKRELARVRVRACPGCPNTFAPVGRQVFCSRQCQSRLWQRAKLGIADPGLIRPCWWCNTDFKLTDGRQYYCSAKCAAIVKSLWNMSSRYGLTREDYRAAWYRQGGLCAVCNRPERTARNTLLSVDHDHATGAFRGLLCSHCNRAFGLLGDDPEVIVRAARYVTESRQVKLSIV